ncbi:MAG: Rieske 2Fe-2S domain-containing protein, partial [Ktedonobacteraceae bacterium]|nr:Rieske 2Fe-2S domain-containing protein [Ktedonobacteraceae bacterium]
SKSKQSANTVIGGPKMAINSAVDFTNPADKKPSVLIHLPDGRYVAYEKACTHVGVFVRYDATTHLLVCPAHGAIFDPANGGKVLQGPATKPLPQVKVHVRIDGRVVVG